MDKNVNGRFLEVHNKNVIPGGSMSVKSRYTYFPLYDNEKASFIRRYQLWAKYRDDCILNNRKFVSVKDYNKVIKLFHKEIENEILINKDGVRFHYFRLQLVKNLFLKKFNLVVRNTLINNKYYIPINYYNIFINRAFKDRVNKLYNQNKLVDVPVIKKSSKKIKKQDLDFFDEFI